MLKKILLGAAIVLVALVTLGYVLPDKAHLEREVVINAPQEEVFAYASDLRNQESWSPWFTYDPAAERVVTGEGIGQKLTWSGRKAGNGSQEITSLEPPSHFETRLAFEGRGHARASMTMAPAEGGTRVVWTYDANMRDGAPLWMQPVATYFGFFMDGFLGKDYERGLANLKREIEES